MLVKEGDRTCLDARAKAEPADPVLTRDFYSQLQRVRLTADAAFHSMRVGTPVEVTLETDAGQQIDVLAAISVEQAHTFAADQRNRLAAIRLQDVPCFKSLNVFHHSRHFSPLSSFTSAGPARAFETFVVRTFRSATPGEPQGSHYIQTKTL
jgi:hypothetical protein